MNTEAAVNVTSVTEIGTGSDSLTKDAMDVPAKVTVPLKCKKREVRPAATITSHFLAEFDSGCKSMTAPAETVQGVKSDRLPMLHPFTNKANARVKKAEKQKFNAWFSQNGDDIDPPFKFGNTIVSSKTWFSDLVEAGYPLKSTVTHFLLFFYI